MRKKNFKGRCEKRVLGKCVEVCRTYDPIQYAYADLLQASDEIKEIRCINGVCWILRTGALVGLAGNLWKLEECAPPVLSVARQGNLGNNPGSLGGRHRF